MDYSIDASFNVGISPTTLLLVSGVSLILCILMLICNWRIFSKAGEPGWMSLIPILNVYKLFEIACGSGWKMVFMFVPFLNFIYGIIIVNKLVKSFGYGLPVTLLYFIATPVAMLILAFGNNEYEGPY